MSKSNDWFYFITASKAKPVGPFSDNQLVTYLKDGTLSPSDKVNSASKTAGEWIEVSKFPKAMAVIESNKEQRDQAIAQRQAEEKAKRDADLDEQQQARTVQQQKRDAELRAISDASSLSAVQKIKAGVSEILMTGEDVMYIAIQTKPIAVKADAVIATTKRLIFYRPKIGGRVQFDDFLWRDLKDAHIKVGVIASTFSCKHVNGSMIVMEYLDKKAGNKLYRIAQEQEEVAFQARRELQLEEKRAGAANFGGYATPPQHLQTQPQQATNTPLEKLKQLKEMFDAGLITQDEFDAKKASLLNEL